MTIFFRNSVKILGKNLVKFDGNMPNLLLNQTSLTTEPSPGLGVDAGVVVDVLEGKVHGAAHAPMVLVVAVNQLLLAQGGL